MLVACRLAGLSALETYYVDVRVRAQFGPTQGSRRPSARFGDEGSCQVARGLPCPSPVARAREENAGAAGSSERINRPWLVLRRGPDRACPRRPRVRYERAGRSFYSAAAAGGAKMTPAQIAEAQRLTR
jgi:hypothetical protein